MTSIVFLLTVSLLSANARVAVQKTTNLSDEDRKAFDGFPYVKRELPNEISDSKTDEGLDSLDKEDKFINDQIETIDDFPNVIDKASLTKEQEDPIEKDVEEFLKDKDLSDETTINDKRSFLTTANGNFPKVDVKYNNKLTIIKNWPKEWFVSFKIKPRGFIRRWSNIILFTTGGQNRGYGYRIPGVWFSPSSTKLYIVSAVNGNSNYVWHAKTNLPLYKFSSVVISQQLNNKGQCIYNIFINGRLVHSEVNSRTQDVHFVKVYASDPYSTSALVSIQDLKFGSKMEKNNEIDPGDTFRVCLNETIVKSCPKNIRYSPFRTITGICNNLVNPTLGAAVTALRRLVPADYVDGITIPRGFPGTSPKVPTANQVSQAVFNVEVSNNGNENGLAVMFMTFGQFLDHDLTEVPMFRCVLQEFGKCANLADSFQDPCLPILFNSSSTACTNFGRSEPVCPQNRLKPGVRELPNELTAFVDISQVYGSEDELAESLRVLSDDSGELKVNNPQDDLLPIASVPKGFSTCSVLRDIIGERTTECRTLGGCSLVGDIRGDENFALHTMHTLWLREHNRIARVLRKANTNWKGEKIFQTARKIVGAIWQHVVYEEFLPRLVDLSPYSEYNPSVDPSVTNSFATAAFRFGHSLIPNSFQQNNNNFDPSAPAIPLQEAFFNREKINYFGIEPTMFGLLGNESNEIDNSFAKGIARKLFVRPGEGFHSDLLALNIQRGRDHGVPTYGSYRKLCELQSIDTFEELKKIMLPKAAEAFATIYDNPNDIDLFAAGISEIHLKERELGPTFGCLVRRQFEAARDGDRFFYKNPGVFTPLQLQAIEKVKFSSVLCENLRGIVSIQPEALLVPDGIKNRRVTCNRIPTLDLKPWIE